MAALVHIPTVYASPKSVMLGLEILLTLLRHIQVAVSALTKRSSPILQQAMVRKPLGNKK